MRWRALVVAGIVATLGAAPAAHAADFTVTTLNDGTGSCAKTDCTTIRAALVAAGQTTETNDTVTVPPGTTTLTAGDLVPPSGVAIIGASARTTIIQGDGKARIFTVGGERTVTFQNLTMQDGTANGGQGGNLLVGASALVGLSHVRVTGGAAAQGAGIAATAPRLLLIVDSLIDHNIATQAASGAGGDGGGIFFQGTSAARTLQINDSTIAVNTARNGGGIDLVTNAQTTATMTRITVARNTSTVSRGGGIHMDSSGTISSTNSIFANNTGNVGQIAPAAGPANCTITFGDGGGNLESQSDCGFKLASDRQNVDPGLSAALFDAGGQTDLFTLPSTSPAVGLAGDCTGVDQRDMPRPQGAACDSGAYEYVDVDTTITGGPSGTVALAVVTFTHTSTDPLAGFECRLDGPAGNGTFAKCGASQTYRSLADGAYTFRVRAVHGDLVDATPDTQTFTMDTTAPNAPAITTPPNNSFQNSTTVTLSGTAEAGSTVEVFEGATSRGTVVATGGTWTRAIPSVGAGSHTYTATARDAAGNVSGNSNSRTITVDLTAPNAPTITTPAADVSQGSRTVNLGGAAETGATVQVFEGATSRGTTTATGGNWSLTINNVADGAHAYVARATDAATNTSGNSNTRTITVDLAIPDTTITGSPGELTKSNAPSFSFESTKANSTFRCKLDSEAFAVCTSPKTYAALAEGQHTFSVFARDALGNQDPTPATVTFTVDTVAPPADVISGPSGPTTETSPAFAFTSTDTGSTFECKLDGPGAAVGSYGACTSPASFSGLQPGEYVFSVRATDGAGNQTVKTRSFTVTSPQGSIAQEPTPTPTPTPDPGKTVVIQPLSGKTLVKLPGSSKFEPVDVTRGIPNGSTVDTKNGKIRLFAIPKAGKPAESALFYQGIFKLKLTGGITELQLVEQLAKCPSGKASAAAKKKPKSRKLWGEGSGSFRTRGQYSSATVRGTKWLVQDSCGKTLTKVAKGVVEVQDFVKRKKVLVRAPKSYTAKQKQ